MGYDMHKDRLIYLLSMAQQRLIQHTNAALSKAGLKVTIAQAGILFLLKQKDLLIMSEIGKMFEIDSSAVTHLIDRLERNGYVERQVPPDNRRATLIHITPEGIKTAKEAGRVIKKINNKIKESFTEGEVETHTKILKGIIDRFKK
jgi:DNA-binding MarR family transcriptional regulator